MVPYDWMILDGQLQMRKEDDLISARMVIYWLVVWNIWIIFPYIGNNIIPTGVHIVQMG